MNDERRFPDINPELRPTAQRVADALRADLPPEVAERHEALLRARAGGADVRPMPRRPGRRPRRTLTALVAAAVLVMALPIVAVASDRAVPGDPLYSVDRAVERFELAVATGPDNEVRALLAQAAERIDELEVLEERGRLEDVDALLEDLRAAADGALERAGADDVLAGTVRDAIEMHTQRLGEVRDRLEASGKASPQALTALDRAIEAGRGATAAEERGRPDDTGRPDDAGRPEDRPDEGPADPATEPPGRPDDAGPSENTPDQAPDDPPADSEGESQSEEAKDRRDEQPDEGNREDQQPDEGNREDQQPDEGNREAARSDEDGRNEDGREFGEDQADDGGNGDGGSDSSAEESGDDRAGQPGGD